MYLAPRGKHSKGHGNAKFSELASFFLQHVVGLVTFEMAEVRELFP